MTVEEKENKRQSTKATTEQFNFTGARFAAGEKNQGGQHQPDRATTERVAEQERIEARNADASHSVDRQPGPDHGPVAGNTTCVPEEEQRRDSIG